MHLSLRFLAASTFLLAGTYGAYAEAPACPGGGTATGTISCTGPVLKPVCTEGPPWTCTLKDDKKVSAGSVRTPPKRFLHIAGSLSESSGGVFDPGTGDTGGDFNDPMVPSFL